MILNELSMLPVSGPWCADRVFCHSHYKRPSQNGTGVPQLWACAKNQPKSIKRSWELFLYLSEVSFSCETQTDALHKHVELLKPILNITKAVIAEVCFMVCLCTRPYPFDRGCPLSHHAIAYMTLDVCGCLTLVGLRKELFQDRRADGRHSCRACHLIYRYRPTITARTAEPHHVVLWIWTDNSICTELTRNPYSGRRVSD